MRGIPKIGGASLLVVLGYHRKFLFVQLASHNRYCTPDAPSIVHRYAGTDIKMCATYDKAPNQDSGFIGFAKG